MKPPDDLDTLLFYLFHTILAASPVIILLFLMLS